MTPISAPARAMLGTTPDVDKRDPPLREAQALAVGHDVEAVAYRLEIVQRLAHAHHHHVGDEALVSFAARGSPIGKLVARQHDLADDLARR